MQDLYNRCIWKSEGVFIFRRCLLFAGVYSSGLTSETDVCDLLTRGSENSHQYTNKLLLEEALSTFKPASGVNPAIRPLSVCLKAFIVMSCHVMSCHVTEEHILHVWSSIKDLFWLGSSGEIKAGWMSRMSCSDLGT